MAPTPRAHCAFVAVSAPSPSIQTPALATPPSRIQRPPDARLDASHAHAYLRIAPLAIEGAQA
eukprot:14718113-Alexandrium_andersonii.AAC.1